jgi:imidazoleglycerol-phosphate dehydratase
MAREGRIERKTKETKIEVAWKLDGDGVYSVSTGMPFFNHMLELFCRHGFFNLNIEAQGDLDIDYHHTVEDIGIAMGRALRQALPGFEGVVRYGHSMVPMDEALCLVSIDMSGRPAFVFKGRLAGNVGTFDVQLVKEFLQGFVREARIALHVNIFYGENMHHKAEAVFKAFGRALGEAVAKDHRIQGALSTKGVL